MPRHNARTPANEVLAMAQAFAHHVTKLRNSRNWSMNELATRAGLTSGYISMLESGERGIRPRRRTVEKLAQAFNIPLDELLEKAGYDETGNPPSSKRVPKKSPVEVEIEKDAALRTDQRDALIMMYRSMTGRLREPPRPG